MNITIYTDGACSGNPGPGGWAAIVNKEGEETILSGGAPHTTNNRMELQAAIEAIRAMKGLGQIKVFTDSQYLQLGMCEWLPRWKKNSWLNSNKKPIKNVDLWQELDELCRRCHVEWHWIRGHTNDEINERADKLARAALEKYRPL